MAILLWVVFFSWAHLLHLEMCTKLPPRDQASSLSQKCNRNKNKEKWGCWRKKMQYVYISTMHKHRPDYRWFYTRSTKNIPHPLRKIQAFLHKSSLIFSLAKWHNKSLTLNSINFSGMISPECICVDSWNILYWCVFE